MTQAQSIQDPRPRRLRGHSLRVERIDEPPKDVYYAAFCVCGWNTTSSFRALVEKEYARHIADRVRESVRQLVGPLGASNEPPTGSVSDIRATEARAARLRDTWPGGTVAGVPAFNAANRAVVEAGNRREGGL